MIREIGRGKKNGEGKREGANLKREKTGKRKSIAE